MHDALIGYTGFVGSTLLKQTSFGSLYRSTNIAEIEDNSFSTVVCAGAPAQKWIANGDPRADLQKIETLIDHLRKVRCTSFILISTSDVFKDPVKVDEDTGIVEAGLHAYGLHRRLLEKFVISHFPKHLIVRLPGLVGPGLRKNIIFDLLNDNNLTSIDSRGVFQFYPMVNLWTDIQSSLQAGLTLVHLTAEPVSVAEVAAEGFNRPFDNVLEKEPVAYDMRSVHGRTLGGTGAYQYSKRETLQAIRTYAQSEPMAKKQA